LSLKFNLLAKYIWVSPFSGKGEFEDYNDYNLKGAEHKLSLIK